jgi:hypothetical protein
MMTILSLVAMIALVLTMPRVGGPASKSTVRKSRGDTVILGKGVRLGRAEDDPDRPGKVSYELLKDNRLPSPRQLMVRRMMRPVSRVYRMFVPGKPKVYTGVRRVRPSAELQNFLDARNAEIARRKAESDLKRGPEDQLH